MASPAQIARQVLVNQGLVRSPGLPGRTLPPVQLPSDNWVVCFTDVSLPDSPDQVLLVTGASGIVFGKDMRAGKSMEHKGVKLVLRHIRPAGYDLLARIADALDRTGMVSVTVGNEVHYVQSFYRVGTVVSLGEETGKRRLLWSINFRVAYQDREP